MEQDPTEFAWLLTRINGVRSILEVGSRDGDTLRAMTNVVVPGAKVRSIDWGHDPTFETGRALHAMIRSLRDRGFDAEVYLEDSHDPSSLNWAKQQGPFDFVFIDGDHSYEGVKQDWAWYGPLATMVGFHDIDQQRCGVPQLWAEIKAAGHQTEEIIAEPGRMGIGIIRRTGITD